MKKINKKIIIAVLLIIVVLTICGQVFASVNGYDNMFFMVKDLRIAKAESKEEIFNDNEILLSYKYLEVKKDIKMQVNKIEIVGGKSIFYINIKNKNQDDSILPFHYIVRVVKKYEDGYIPVFRPEAGGEIYVGNKPNTNNYQDKIEIPLEIEDDEIIYLEVLDKENNNIRTFTINIETQEIIVTGEKEEIEKISQIEFNKYLSAFALLNDESNKMDKMSRYLYISAQLQRNIPEIKNTDNLTDREFENEIVKSITSENIDMKKLKNKENEDFDVLNLEKEFFVYDNELDAYICNFETVKEGECLKINDISYKDGIYTVKYIYIIKSTEDIQKNRIEELPQKEMNLKLRLHETSKYAKYQIVVDEDENKEEKEDKKEENKTSENTIENKTEKTENETKTEEEKTTNIVTEEKEDEKNNVEENKVAEENQTDESKEVKEDEQSTNVRKVKNVKTGDHIWIYFVLIGGSVIALVTVIVIRKRNKINE